MGRLRSYWDFHRLFSLISHQCHTKINKISSSRIPKHIRSSSGDSTKEVDPSSNPRSTDIKPTRQECATEELKNVLLEPPTNCCMSGCSNCVWIVYAENLAKLTKDGGQQARELIEKNVTDPCLKAFLLTELKMRQ